MDHKEFSSRGGSASTPAKKKATAKSLKKARAALAAKRKAAGLRK